MEKPVDTAQIVLDNRGKKGNQAAASGSGGGSSVLGLVLKSIAVLFVVCNVTALYVLHFVNHPSPTTRFTLSSFSATPGTKASEGDAVSLSPDNKLRNGAGTTAYLDRTTLADTGVTYYEYLNVAKSGTSAKTFATNLMSYRRVKIDGTTTTKESVLTSFTVNKLTKTVSISSSFDTTKNVVASDAIRGIATVSDTQALVLTVDDSQSLVRKAYVMSATISSTAVVLDQTTKLGLTSDATIGLAAYVTPLGSTTAIVAYYQPYVDATTTYDQLVKIATIASDGKVTLSTGTTFATSNRPSGMSSPITVNWGRPVVTSSAKGTFAIPYYTSTNVGLCVTMSKYDYTAGTLAAFPAVSATPCTTAYSPTYFIESIMLSDNVLVMAFHDKAKNNALTLVAATVTDTTVYFRSSYVFSEVAGDYDYGALYGFSPELSLAVLSGNRVSVSFLNPSTKGRQSIKVLQYSLESLALKDVTPVLPLAPSSFTISMNSGTKFDKSVTQKILAVGDDTVVAMYLGARGDTAYQHVALVESFGVPMGVLRNYNGKAKADVAVSGKVKDVSTHSNMKMTVGQFYYATTAGYLVSPASTTEQGAEYFTTAEDSKMIVTANSKVGVAIDKDELFVAL